MENPNNKLVTIGLTVRNGAPRIRRALDSLLAQSYRNFELLISNNASEDDTEKICKEYARMDPRIHYVRQKKNIGQVNNLRYAIYHARGEYFMWAADDDWRDLFCLEKLVEALEKNPHAGIAMSSYTNVYPEGILKNIVVLAGDYNPGEKTYGEVFKQMVLDRPIHHFLHGLHRTSFLKKIFRRPAPRCIRWDRIFMAEYALAARMVAVQPVLFYKTFARVPIAARYANDAVGTLFADRFAYTRYVGLMLWRPLSSPVVPVSQKVHIFSPWLTLVWRYKRRLASELLGKKL